MEDVTNDQEPAMPCWPYTGFTSQSCSYIYILSQHIHVVLSLGVARIEVRAYVCVFIEKSIHLCILYIINICVFAMHEKKTVLLAPYACVSSHSCENFR